MIYLIVRDHIQLLLHFLTIVVSGPHGLTGMHIPLPDHKLIIPSFYLVMVSALYFPFLREDHVSLECLDD